MSRPKDDIERLARDNWQGGGEVRAMQDLRAAGYDERQRADFLTRVAGVRQLGDLELHRDSYLRWRDQEDLDERQQREAPARPMRASRGAR